MKTDGKQPFPTGSAKGRTALEPAAKRLNELQVFAREGLMSGFARTARIGKRLY